VRLPEPERDAKVIQAAVEGILTPPFRVLDGALAGRDHGCWVTPSPSPTSTSRP
jgi:hypothetical protein